MYEKYKKMKKHYYYLITCLTALLLAACQNETPVERTHRAEFKLTLAGEIDQLYLSRVNDNGFADGDVMGVYVVDYVSQQPGKLKASGNRGTNVKHTFDEPNFKWNSSYDIYFRDDKTPVDIYGYYPYSAKNPEDPENYAFQVQHDQQIAAHDGLLSGYEQSDFLWGKVAKVYATEHVIRLPMKHRLGNVCVKLKEGKGFSQGEWAELKKTVMVLNTTTDALINLSTGECTPQGEPKEAGILPHEHEGEYRAIVVPQTVGSGKTLFSITVEGVAYKFSKDVATVYEAGKMTNYTIEVNKKSVTDDYEFRLTGENITPWEADLASHEGNMKEYVVVNVPKAGTLKECIAAAGKDYTRIQSLKITGQIDYDDFIFMRGMKNLSALNLKEVKIMKSNTFDEYGNQCAEDMIPDKAFSVFDNAPRLYNLVLPDNLKTIGGSAFHSQSLSGSLIIPEGVKEIKAYAFYKCNNLTGTLSLPSTLEIIGYGTFEECGFTCELLLPQNLKSIRGRAFKKCENLYGNLILPDGLSIIEDEAFFFCKNLKGDLKIPQKVKKIGNGAFKYSGLNGRLTLSEGLEYIGDNAFIECKFRGPLVMPSTLKSIGVSAFEGNSFFGELKLPISLQELGESAFNASGYINGTLEIPENITAIKKNTFSSCSGTHKIILPSTMDVIHSYAFYLPSGIIVCKAVNPPYVGNGYLAGVSKDNVVVEVPLASLAAYRTAPGWSDFKKIVAHHELICSPYSVVALNASLKKKLVINAESDWEVEKCPSWCHLDKTSGSKKTEITLTIDALAKGQEPREDDIVFVLKDKGYTTSCSVSQCSYDYDEDEVITLQKATRGNGVNLVFLGDGYNNKDIVDGTYLKDMKQQMEYFFGVEPYTTYRDYFNVYTAIALSQESGVGNVNALCENKFGIKFTNGASLRCRCNTEEVFKYALRMPTVNRDNLNQTLIVLTPNTMDYGGATEMWSDGSAISITPNGVDGYPSRGIVQHEAGGHGFGKLGDECVYLNSFIQNSASEAEFNAAKANGWYENLSLTNKMHEVPWAHLIFNNKYNEVVDIYEGGFMYARGVFRSELNSCMNNSVPYFNAISREAIVKRIKQYAGETYSFDEFVKNDNPNPGSRSTRYDVAPWNKLSDKPAPNHSQPIIHKGSPKF